MNVVMLQSFYQYLSVYIDHCIGLRTTQYNITLAALSTRIIALLIILLFTLIVPSHIPYGVYNFVWNDAQYMLNAFARWDSAYYLSIARDGYTHEQTYAFFPLYPMLVRIILLPLLKIFPIEADALLCFSAIFLSNTAFILSCYILYKLLRCYATEEIALKAVVLYMINPASIFFVTSYSESLFSLFSFAGMYHSVKQHHWQAAICFFGAAYTRSNGVFYVIFGFYPIGKYVVSVLLSSPVTPASSTALVPYTIIAAPYLLHNHFIHTSLCPSALRLCSFPFYSSYSVLQAEHWDVGWMRRFHVRQLPNFVLAAPMIACVVLCVTSVFRPLYNRLDKSAIVSVLMSPLAPHIVHMLVMTFICFFVAHVQITTRVIASSCPILYLILAQQLQFPATRLWILFYFLLYALLGLVLHPNHYPWT